MPFECCDTILKFSLIQTSIVHVAIGHLMHIFAPGEYLANKVPSTAMLDLASAIFVFLRGSQKFL